MVHEIFSFTGNKRIALIFPAGESAEHHFHRPPKLSQLQRGNVSTVAVRPGAVDHKEGLRRPGGHSLGGDLAVREMLRAWQVTSGEGFLAADHVQQDKVDLAGTLGAVHIGAVGLKMQLMAEPTDSLSGSGREIGLLHSWRLLLVCDNTTLLTPITLICRQP